MRQSSSRGFTLIEILLVVGLAAALAIAAFVIYDQVSRKAKTSQAIAQMDKLALGSMQLWNARHRLIPVAQGGDQHPSWYLRRAGYFTDYQGSASQPRPVTPFGTTISILAIPQLYMPYFMYDMPRDASVCLDIMQHLKGSSLYAYALMSSDGGTVLLKQEPQAYITPPSASNEPTIANMARVCDRSENGNNTPLIRFVPALR